MRFILPLLLLCIPSWSMSAEKIPGLGTASFPTSTKSAAAQHEFIRGLLLLHLFEYPDAAKAFVAAEKLDPNFAMAYWGEAMTFNHPVWNQLDAKAGQAALVKFAPTPQARASRIADPRERAFMGAVEILYSGQGTKRERDAQYADAMEQMSRTYPADDEVQLFYALALLGRSEGVRDVPTYLKAAAIAKAAFARNPDHPGAAHYWIHGMDDPQHAAGALEAARALSKIAPDAGHAQHMCSHIFIALGMWDDVVDANINAMRVVDEHARADGKPVIDCGHYDIWLEYGYYQQGRIQDGNGTLQECKRTGEEASRQQPNKPMGVNHSLIAMRGIAVIETEDWNGPAATMTIDMRNMEPGAYTSDAFTTGYAAAMRNDKALAATSLATVRDMVSKEANAADVNQEQVNYDRIMAQELSALVASETGDLQSAVKQAQEAAAAYDAMAFDFGPPATVKPPDELVGELLLRQKQYPDARKAFEESLQRAPRRVESLTGLARAESGMGDDAAARASYGELAKIWKNADPGYAPKTEAETFVATHSQTASASAVSDEIAAAVLPLPVPMRSGAGVVRLDANFHPVMLRQTTNGMVCIAPRSGSAKFDVRCYEQTFIPAVYRGFQIGFSGVGDEIKQGKLQITNQPTAGYRCLGPSSGYDPATNSVDPQIKCWQSIHFPFHTAAEIGLPNEGEIPAEQRSMIPYVMASGSYWAHVMIEHPATK